MVNQSMTKGAGLHTGVNTVYSINNVGKIGLMQKHETGPTSYII